MVHHVRGNTFASSLPTVRRRKTEGSCLHGKRHSWDRSRGMCRNCGQMADFERGTYECADCGRTSDKVDGGLWEGKWYCDDCRDRLETLTESEGPLGG